MRRFLYVVMLIGRFAGQSYVWRSRTPQRPVPIVRPMEIDPRAGVRPAWWMLP